jgi:HlyD family secretion protein
MTATVRAIAQRHDGVLRVPSAALRFRPAPELIEKAASPPGGAGTAVAAEGPSKRGGDRPGGGARGGREGPVRWTKVYLPHGNQVAAVRFRPGIADDEFTEILAGDVKEGDDVVIDAVGGPQSSSSSSSPGSATRGRGPRFF